MTRKEAIEFIKESGAVEFYYGYDAIPMSKRDALEDIILMDDERWNNGIVIESGEIQKD